MQMEFDNVCMHGLTAREKGLVLFFFLSLGNISGLHVDHNQPNLNQTDFKVLLHVDPCNA